MPEGIVVTFGKEMMLEHGGYRTFIRGWLDTMEKDDWTWKHFVRNVPTKDVVHVYIIILNRLAYRCNFVGYEAARPNIPRYKANGEPQQLVKPGILMCGPAIKCPFKRELKGFHGFRYSTKLF